MSEKKPSFYINAELQTSDKALIMKYRYLKSAGHTKETDIHPDKMSWMASFTHKAGNVMGSLHGSVVGAQKCGEYFAEMVIDCAMCVLEDLKYSCDAQPVLVHANDEEIFVAVMVGNLKSLGKKSPQFVSVAPSCFFQIHLCKSHLDLPDCCDNLQMPINLETVAQRIEEMLLQDVDSPVSIPAKVSGEYPETERLLLCERGFAGASLPDSISQLGSDKNSDGGTEGKRSFDTQQSTEENGIGDDTPQSPLSPEGLRSDDQIRNAH